MYKNLYVVTFDNDCNSYYFHNKDNAIEFAWEAYCDDYVTYDETVIAEDAYNLINNHYIEDYCWITEEIFED